MRALRTIAAPAVAALATMALAGSWSPARADGETFFIKGKVQDVRTIAIPGMRVRIFEDDGLLGDTLVGTTYTGADGRFAVNLPLAGVDDPYIIIDWYFQLTSIPGQHIIIEGELTGDTVWPPFKACIRSDLGLSNGDTVDCNTLTMGFALNPARASVANLTKLINQAMTFYVTNKGTIAWTFPYDIPVKIRTDTIVSSHLSGTIRIADVDINAVNVMGLGQGWQSDIYHESAHLVHYRTLPSGFPDDGVTNRSHGSNSEKSPRFALKEGWASFVQDRTDVLPNHANDGKVQPVDPNLTYWRGGSSYDVDGTAESMLGATGMEGTSFENGEEVEGALEGFFKDFFLDATFGAARTNFTPLFRAMVDDQPDSIFPLVDGLVADLGGANTAATKKVYELAQKHGMFWTRGRFASQPFDEDGPPDDAASAEEGNFLAIDDYAFVRGMLTARIEQLGRVDLGVATRIPATKVRIGYREALDSLAGVPANFTMFSASTNVDSVNASHPLDTTTFAGQGPDGDGRWDLLVRVTNEDGFEDDFRPTWVGDATAKVNTDEKYLKTVGTWFDLDRNHMTQTIKGGMVVVDNKAPVVVPGSFKPQ